MEVQARVIHAKTALLLKLYFTKSQIFDSDFKIVLKKYIDDRNPLNLKGSVNPAVLAQMMQLSDIDLEKIDS